MVSGQLRIKAIELPHFTVRAPTSIARPGLLKISICDRLEAAGRVKARRKLIRDCFVVQESVRAGRTDRTLVQALGFELAAFDAREFGAQKSCSVLEILRALSRPNRDLSVVSRQCPEVPLAPLDIFKLNRGRVTKRSIKVVLRRFHECHWYRKQPFGSPRGSKSSRIFPCVEASLKFPYAVEALRDHLPLVARQMRFEHRTR